MKSSATGTNKNGQQVRLHKHYNLIAFSHLIVSAFPILIEHYFNKDDLVTDLSQLLLTSAYSVYS